MSDLQCPRCRSAMTRYERNGVVVDQCVECKGLFLDRGELDHLIRAEAVFYDENPAAAAPPSPVPHDEGPRYDERPRYDDRSPHDEKSPKKKRRGFLEDLLDFG